MLVCVAIASAANAAGHKKNRLLMDYNNAY
jgi:hypothetical protein